jgi:hypothetical protein
VSFTARVANESQQHAVGETIPVVYPPQFPQAAEIDNARHRVVRNILAAIGALLLIAIGGTVAWQASRLHRRRIASSA